MILLNGYLLFTYKAETTCPDEYKLADGACEEGKSETEIIQEFKSDAIDLLYTIVSPILLVLLSILVIIQFMNYTLLNIMTDLKKPNKPKKKLSNTSNSGQSQPRKQSKSQKCYLCLKVSKLLMIISHIFI